MSSTLARDPQDRAFERLYERYVREVYRYVFAVLRNPADAEDVTQTTFLNAYRALQAGVKPRTPHNWLIAIAHNACRSSVRLAMRRAPEVPLDDLTQQLAAQDSEGPNVRELLRALGKLPFNQRSAIALRELEGRSYPEIAETLGVSVPAVEALIARARRTLRLQATALRGLTVLQLPRSLRKLFENGEAAAGGALGAGVVAKVAAVVVASGLGLTSLAAGTHRQSAVPRLGPHEHAVPLQVVAPPHLTRVQRAVARQAAPTGHHVAPGRSAAPPDPETLAATAPAGEALATPLSQASGQIQDPVATSVQHTAAVAAATVPASVAQPPALPVLPLPALVPPVQPPSPPALPQLPDVVLPPPPPLP